MSWTGEDVMKLTDDRGETVYLKVYSPHSGTRGLLYESSPWHAVVLQNYSPTATVPCKVAVLSPALHLRIVDCQKSFSEEHKITSRTKEWGSTSSFKNGYTAVCITLHPANLVEYTIPSAERAIILFDHPVEDTDRNAYSKFPWERKPLCIQPATAHYNVWRKIQDISFHKHTRSLMDSRLVYLAFCASLLWKKYIGSEDVEQAKASLRLIQETASFEQELNSLADLSGTALDPKTSLETLNTLIQKRSTIEVDQPPTQRLLEYCRISGCNELLLWNGLSRARCKRGHTWSKADCSITT